MDTVKIVPKLSGTAPSVAAIDAGHVVFLALARLNWRQAPLLPSGGGTTLFLGMSLAGIACFARRKKLALNS